MVNNFSDYSDIKRNLLFLYCITKIIENISQIAYNIKGLSFREKNSKR